MNFQIPQLLVERLGWTLVHFVWQGVFVAAALALALRWLRNAKPNPRYLAGCAALIILAIAPLATFKFLSGETQPVHALQRGTSSGTASAKDFSSPIESESPIVFTAKPVAVKVNFAERLEKILPWLVACWVAGVLACTARLFVGWLQIKSLQTRATVAVGEPWQNKLAALRQRLGVSRPVRLLQSALVEVPTVIGWLRPVILLPASCLVGLAPQQLEAILAHELAHIRRHDYLVNVLQNVVETFLFYHPAVWWVSRRIREEREHCCDDLAVEAYGDRISYARALASLEELRHAPALLALGAGGAPLLGRIRRLAGKSANDTGRSAWPLAGIVLLFVVFALAGGLRGNRAVAQESSAASTNTNNRAVSNPISVTASSAVMTSNTVTFEGPTTVHVAASHDTTSTNVAGQTATFTGLAQGTTPITYQWNFTNAKISGASNASVKVNLTNAKPVTVPHASKMTFGRREIIAKLNDIVLDSVKYDHVSLDDVARDLGNISAARAPDGMGINFYIDPRVPSDVAAGIDPHQIGVNLPELHHLRIADVLDAITHTADVPIKYSVLDYAVVLSVAEAAGPMETRIFRIDPNTFRQGLEGVQGIPFGNNLGGSAGGSGGTGGGGTSGGGQSSGVLMPRVNVTTGISGVTGPSGMAATGGGTSFGANDGGNLNSATVRQFIASLGVDLDPHNPANAGKSVDYDDRSSSIVVHAPPGEMKAIEAGINRVSPPPKQLNIALKVFAVSEPFDFMGFISSNSTVIATGGTSPPPISHLSGVRPIVGIMSEEQFKTTISALEHRGGVETLVSQQIVTLDHRFAKIAADISPTNLLGPSFEFFPSIGPDNRTIELSMISWLPERESTGKAVVGDYPDYDPGKFGLSGPNHIATLGPVSAMGYVIRPTDNIVKLLDCQTAVVGNLRYDPPGRTNAPKSLLIFVTPTLINPDGTRMHGDNETATDPNTRQAPGKFPGK
jgi:beta-lactamase regulating signal transducer with metallopeptidase domain